MHDLYYNYKAAKVLKQQTVFAKQKQKNKSDAMTQLNTVSLPLAKFETDIQALRSSDKEHPMLNLMTVIFDKGVDLKNKAVHAMNNNEAVTNTPIEVKAFLAECKEQSKVCALLVKSLKK